MRSTAGSFFRSLREGETRRSRAQYSRVRGEGFMKSLSGFRTGRARNRGGRGVTRTRRHSYRPIGAKLDFFHPGWEEKSLGAGAQPDPRGRWCAELSKHTRAKHTKAPVGD